MKRRRFLQYTGAATAVATVQPALFGGTPVYSRSGLPNLGVNFTDNDKILIVIQLFGGNDGLNTIVPAEDDDYFRLRPDIAITTNTGVQIAGSNSYFHPALVETYNDGFLRLHDEGRLAIVQGIGYDNPNLSHFRSTDIWLSGYNPSDEDIFSNPNVRLLDGWIGRLAAETIPNFPMEVPEHPISIQIGGLLSLMLRSEAGDAGIAINDPEQFFELGRGLTPDEDPLPGDSAYEQEYNYILQVARDSDRYSQVVLDAYNTGQNSVEYGDGFARQMGLVARLISGGLNTKVYMLSMGGFDNHVNQATDEGLGLHANLLRSLSEGISRFMADAVDQGFADRVVGMTVTEFGRRPQQNGSRGTDHGTASVQFLFGEAVRAGLYGNNPNLSNNALAEGRGNIIYENDYRRVYAEILENWFGASKENVETILGKRFVHMGLLETVTGVDNPLVAGPLREEFSLYPNPSRGTAQMSFELRRPAAVDVSLYTMRGVHIHSFRHGLMGAGVHSIPLSIAKSGSYLCVLEIAGRQYSKVLTVLR